MDRHWLWTALRLGKFALLGALVWGIFAILFIEPTLWQDYRIFGADIYFLSHLLELVVFVALAFAVFKAFKRFETR